MDLKILKFILPSLLCFSQEDVIDSCGRSAIITACVETASRVKLSRDTRRFPDSRPGTGIGNWLVKTGLLINGKMKKTAIRTLLCRLPGNIELFQYSLR